MAGCVITDGIIPSLFNQLHSESFPSVREQSLTKSSNSPNVHENRHYDACFRCHMLLEVRLTALITARKPHSLHMLLPRYGNWINGMFPSIFSKSPDFVRVFVLWRRVSFAVDYVCKTNVSVMGSPGVTN